MIEFFKKFLAFKSIKSLFNIKFNLKCKSVFLRNKNTDNVHGNTFFLLKYQELRIIKKNIYIHILKINSA